MGYDTIETFKLDDKKVHKLTLELKNPRLEGEALERIQEMPPLRLAMDRKRRMLTGGPLTFMEAKMLVREQLSFDKWKITFYEVVQFPQIVFFDTEYQAKKFFKRATETGRGAKGGILSAQRMELYKPAEHIWAEREQVEAWKAKDYTPDPMTIKGYR